MGAIREVFGDKMPNITSTKSLTGHSLGAAGVQESIYSILMMQGGFIGESAHIEELDPEFEGMPIVRKRIDNAKIDTVLSNSFGFGGTNATLVFQRHTGMRDHRHGRIDEGQARAHHGRRQRSFDRLGHRPEAGRAWRRTGLHLSGRGLRPPRQAAGREGRRLARRALRRRGQRLGRLPPSRRSRNEWGGIDFLVHAIGFSDKNELKGLYADTTRENFVRTMVISCFSFTEVARTPRR